MGTVQVQGDITVLAQDGLAVTGFQPFITLRDAHGANARAVVQGVQGDLVLVPNSFIGSGGAAMVVKSGSGNVGIGTSNPDARLHVTGTVIADDIILPGADCAEEFDVDASHDINPGDVMVIGEDEEMRLCHDPYDKRVAGVVSGAGGCRPGVVLGRRATSEPRAAIALSGTAWCKVDAGDQPVGVGDLLTTSGTPGHAMKAVDQRKMFGAVIGKALRPLPFGQGLIPILIALQ